MSILVGLGMSAGYLAIGATIGTLWAKFMPRWNMIDARDHIEDCNKPYSEFGGHLLCDCPATRKKTKEAKERDFWVFTTLWIFAVPATTFFAFIGALTVLAERGESYYRNHVQQRLRNLL